MRCDVVVLGAGIVGASVAAHLARRGVDVALVDRRGPGEETSFGNAGLIEPSGVVPTAFPRHLPTVLRAAIGRLPHANIHYRALPALMPFLARYVLQSSPANLRRSAAALHPLLKLSADAHRDLLDAAGRGDLLRPTGYMRIFRTARALDEHLGDDAPIKASYGYSYAVLDRDAAIAREPMLRPVFHSAVWWHAPVACVPGEVTMAIAGLVPRHGGRVMRGDARTLRQVAAGFEIDTEEGPLSAAQAVVALGPWSTDITTRFGLKLPFGIKRGYHQHFRPAPGPALTTPLLDVEGGYFLAPMPTGLRLSTGIEFAARDAPPTPVQIAATRPYAEDLLGIGGSIDAEPWMGRRPCLPDSLPVIGAMPGVPGMTLAFGHQHLGLTLGPVTGKLVAQLLTGETPCADPAPYGATRFG